MLLVINENTVKETNNKQKILRAKKWHHRYFRGHSLNIIALSSQVKL